MLCSGSWRLAKSAHVFDVVRHTIQHRNFPPLYPGTDFGLRLCRHGNSHFEAAPSDLQAEKSGKGLQISITLEFFRSFSDQMPKVRCRISVLPAFHTYDPLTEDPLATTLFEPDCPNITIHLPIAPLLPITLSTLATTISKAHTVSRKVKKSSSSRYLQNPQERAIKDLSTAVDLFKRLNGEEVVEDAGVVEKDENGLLFQIKGRLKRRRKGAVIVEGGADGGVGMPLGNSGPLPDGESLLFFYQTCMQS